MGTCHTQLALMGSTEMPPFKHAILEETQSK